MTARRGTPPCPVPPHATGGSLGCGAPCYPLLCLAILDPLPSGASTVRSNSRGSAPSLRPSLPRPPGPVLPPVCSPSLALPCPSSLVAKASGLLCLCPSPSVLSPPLPYLRPPASASRVRSNSRGNPPSLLLPSAPAPWPSPAPCVLVFPRPPLPPFPGPWVPGPLSPSLLAHLDQVLHTVVLPGLTRLNSEGARLNRG